MGQAILVKAKDFSYQETEVPPVTDRCQILLRLRWPDGGIAINWPVNCNDGGYWYNYVTDDKGEVLFSTNSGTPKIDIPNILTSNRLRVLDINKVEGLSVQAPVGTVQRINHNFTRVVGAHINDTESNNCVYSDSTIKQIRIEVHGGGGGGASGIYSGTGYGYEINYGGTGGEPGDSLARIVPIANISGMGSFTKLVYSLGSRGRGGESIDPYNNSYLGVQNGGRGGTTTMYGVSALGGNGGISNYYTDLVNPNVGTPSRYVDDSVNIPNDAQFIKAKGKRVGYGGAYYNFASRPENGTVARSYYTGNGNGGNGACLRKSQYDDSQYVLEMPSSAVLGGGGGGGFCGNAIPYSSNTNANFLKRYYNGGYGATGYINLQFG